MSAILLLWVLSDWTGKVPRKKGVSCQKLNLLQQKIIALKTMFRRSSTSKKQDAARRKIVVASAKLFGLKKERNSENTFQKISLSEKLFSYFCGLNKVWKNFRTIKNSWNFWNFRDSRSWSGTFKTDKFDFFCWKYLFTPQITIFQNVLTEMNFSMCNCKEWKSMGRSCYMERKTKHFVWDCIVTFSQKYSF